MLHLTDEREPLRQLTDNNAEWVREKMMQETGGQPSCAMLISWGSPTDDNKIPGVLQEFSKFSLGKNKMISSNFCHSSSN